jgi:hypothetical protein
MIVLVAHPMPDCSVTSVTFAPALDCVFSVNWYAAMGSAVVPSET